MKNIKKDAMMFAVGITLGYVLVQGFSYLHQNYLWALFYH